MSYVSAPPASSISVIQGSIVPVFVVRGTIGSSVASYNAMGVFIFYPFMNRNESAVAGWGYTGSGYPTAGDLGANPDRKDKWSLPITASWTFSKFRLVNAYLTPVDGKLRFWLFKGNKNNVEVGFVDQEMDLLTADSTNLPKVIEGTFTPQTLGPGDYLFALFSAIRTGGAFTAGARFELHVS